MRIETNNASHDMEFTTKDFETPVQRHEENGKLEKVLDKSALVNENVHTWLV